MSELEERNLRDMLEQAAGEPPRWVSVDSIRRRAVQRRVSQAAVTSLAVLAVGLGATFSAYAARSGPTAGGTKAPTGPPKYYVQQEFSKKAGEQSIAVRVRATGGVTSIVRNPLPKFRCGRELAAAGRHTFFETCVTWTLKPNGKSTIKTTQIYRFEVNNSGHATTPTLLKGGIFKRLAGYQLAASPDGSQVAIEVTPPNANGVIYTDSIPSGIFVLNTKTGKRAFWRTGPSVPGKLGFFGASDISFTQNGNEMVLLEALCTRHQNKCQSGYPTEVKAYGPADRGGSLQGGQILLRQPSEVGKPGTFISYALITPDGTALNAVIGKCPKRGSCTVAVERIGLATGQAPKVLYKVHIGSRAFGIKMREFSSDPSGRFFMLNAAETHISTWVNGWIDHGRLVRLAPSYYDGVEVW